MIKEIDEKTILKNWFSDLIDTFRKEYNKLTPDQKKHIPINRSYKKPCQIEVFWIKEPFECQLIVYVHDPDRNDKEIIINGPFEKSSFKSELINIMNEPRWNKKAKYEEKSVFYSDDLNIGFEGKRYSDFLISPLMNLYWYFDKDPSFAKNGNLYGGGSFFGKDGWSQIIIGNIAEFMDINSIIKPDIEGARNFKPIKYKNELSEIGEPVKKTYSYGGYYYPLLRIGNEVELSFSQKYEILIEETKFFPKKEFKFTIGEVNGFYDTLGFIAIQTDDKARVLNMLNTIFGVSYAFGYKCLSIKESELSQISELPNVPHVFVSGWQITDTKRPIQGTYYGQRKQQIEFEQMDQILKISECILKDENLNELIHLLLESFTHFYNSEYSQSFLYSWFIIEKYIAQLFDDLLAEKNVTGDRKKKYKTQDKWSSDTRIEVLSLNDKIPSEEYNLISKYNTKRNHFVHRGESVEKEDAQTVLNLSKKIITNKITLLLQ